MHRNDIYEFFTSERILGSWSKIETLEATLSRFEQKYGTQSEIIHQRYEHGKEFNRNKFTVDFSEWVSAYQTWLTTKADYEHKIKKLKLQKISLLKQDASKVEADAVQLTSKETTTSKDINHHSYGQSGADFLMSIAGMFESNTISTSENVGSIVTEFILNKHGKTNASAN